MYNQVQITYQVPYNDCEWRVQSFPDIQEAQNMFESTSILKHKN